MAKIVFALPTFLAAQAVWAADLLTVPEGCTAAYTVHKSACHATTVFDCDTYKEAHTFRDGDLGVIHIYSPDWEIREFRFAEIGGARMSAVPGTGTTMKLRELVEAGEVQESGDFLLNTDVIKDRKYILSGRVVLSGEEIELGGETFRKGRIYRDFELVPGNGGLEFEVEVFISPDRGLLFEAGWQRSIFGSNLEVFEQVPMSISWPGDDGFLAKTPAEGCEEAQDG